MSGPWPDCGAAYDAVAADYAAAFADELAAKPFDRVLLDEFAAAVRPVGQVLDVGCGAAGHITRYLADRGVGMVGFDLSPESIAVAKRYQPQLTFAVADMTALPAADDAMAGIVAFYSVIHLPAAAVPAVLAGFWRVLQPGGHLLLAMHGGTGEIGASNWFGRGAEFRASLWSLDALSAAVEAAGFAMWRKQARQPYPAEHATERLYIWAGKPGL